MEGKLEIGSELPVITQESGKPERRRSLRVVRIVPVVKGGNSLDGVELEDNQGVVSGVNLLDDPRYRGRADPGAIYIVEW